MNCFALADRLHKTVSEIEEIPFDEFLGWIAYFQITEEANNGPK